MSRETLHRNKWWTYWFDLVELPSGETGEYHYVHTNGSSMVIPVTDDGKILLVRQYRYLGDRVSIEFPCGGVKDGSSHEETAKQELAEETGFYTREIESIGSFSPCNGLVDETCRVYIARGLKQVDAHPDETENFELIHLAVDELEKLIAKGDIWDGMTIAAWAIVKSKLLV
jgi:ADP-ribose pyrophosphatase